MWPWEHIEYVIVSNDVGNFCCGCCALSEGLKEEDIMDANYQIV